ncbi:MAG TPA: hypothetical protein ENK85_07020 [Saprospiraceae bacterium]|nr:hypothetical protein [Saprospiraceae bacterium]
MPDATFYRPFEKPTKEEWLQILGENASKKLVVSDSIQTPVFIYQAPTYPPLAGKKDNDWNIVEQIKVSNIQKANHAALNALNGGAEELLFVLRKPIDPSKLLSSIELPMIHSAFEIKNAGTKKWVTFMEALAQTTQNSTAIQGSFLLEPFSKSNRLKPGLKAYLQKGTQLFPRFKLISLRQNSQLDVEAALARLIQQTEQLSKSIKDVQLIATKIRFRLLAGQNILITIASIRAFKRLWIHWLKQHQLPPALPDISVVLDNSHWPADPNQNRILATTQAMASVIGGCNHLLIPPVASKMDDFSVRISRNIQHIMKMESHMDRVVDPAAGSKVVETLTDAIAQGAWDLLRL